MSGTSPVGQWPEPGYASSRVFACRVADALRRGARSVGVEAPELTSGAGHDAQNPALAGVPTGMLFVRSTGGSHKPSEFASLDDAALGAQALANTLREIAG